MAPNGHSRQARACPLWGQSGLRLSGGGLLLDPKQPSKSSHPNANDFYLDVATSEDFGLSVTAESGRPTAFKPTKAVASIPTAMIKPTMAFALSHRSNSR